MIGNAVVKTVVQLFTSNTTFATVFTWPISGTGRFHLRFWIPITVGAAGGVKLRFDGPVGLSNVKTTEKLFNTVAPSLTTGIQTAVGSAFSNALANAGNHWLEIEGDFENAGAAGDVVLQMAQNTSDAASLQILPGSYMSVTQY